MNTYPLGVRRTPAASKAEAYQSGFTLIELLTSITITAILTAILFPLFGSARDNAEMTRTASDLRQVYNAVTLYTTSNSGVLPGPAYAGISAGFRERDQSLTRYLAPYLTVTPNPLSSEYSTVEEFLPATYEELASNYNELGKGPVYLTNSYYTEDFSQPFGYPPAGNNEAQQPKQIHQIPDPARNVMIYALDQQNLDGSPGWKGSLADSPFFGNLRPFLYWDGHVVMTESMTPEDDLLDNG